MRSFLSRQEKSNSPYTLQAAKTYVIFQHHADDAYMTKKIGQNTAIRESGVGGGTKTKIIVNQDKFLTGVGHR